MNRWWLHLARYGLAQSRGLVLLALLTLVGVGLGALAPWPLKLVIDHPLAGEALPPGTAGEICVRGYSRMQGLYKVEREETFDADGFYHTGDGGRFDEDGVLFFEARLGDVIKTSGANVTPREVEVLLEAQGEVSSAYVVGLPDPVRGQNVAAALVLKPGASFDADTCRERLKADLSAYKIPRQVFLCEKGELPFTDSGKIDKRRLAAILAERPAS